MERQEIQNADKKRIIGMETYWSKNVVLCIESCPERDMFKY